MFFITAHGLNLHVFHSRWERLLLDHWLDCFVLVQGLLGSQFWEQSPLLGSVCHSGRLMMLCLMEMEAGRPQKIQRCYWWLNELLADAFSGSGELKENERRVQVFFNWWVNVGLYVCSEWQDKAWKNTYKWNDGITMHGDLGNLKIQRKTCFVSKRQLGCYQKQKDTYYSAT